ncbi:unnamed protein product [Protopolystoma xenopodis]|uniref:Uncharacterized protein n=1 Tax=Protopolystoma xenopodis TaxID=117903 RepID=A0A3S5AD42_9PLAT|nr:unnamed protein product [Protopolystoma xenopodis]
MVLHVNSEVCSLALRLLSRLWLKHPSVAPISIANSILSCLTRYAGQYNGIEPITYGKVTEGSSSPIHEMLALLPNSSFIPCSSPSGYVSFSCSGLFSCADVYTPGAGSEPCSVVFQALPDACLLAPTLAPKLLCLAARTLIIAAARAGSACQLADSDLLSRIEEALTRVSLDGLDSACIEHAAADLVSRGVSQNASLSSSGASANATNQGTSVTGCQSVATVAGTTMISNADVGALVGGGGGPNCVGLCQSGPGDSFSNGLLTGIAVTTVGGVGS